MNLSSRELTEVPLEIWNMYHVDPDKVVVDFNSSGNAWYDAVDLTRFIAADNKITFIDGRIHEFGALVAVDVCFIFTLSLITMQLCGCIE